MIKRLSVLALALALLAGFDWTVPPPAHAAAPVAAPQTSTAVEAAALLNGYITLYDGTGYTGWLADHYQWTRQQGVCYLTTSAANNRASSFLNDASWGVVVYDWSSCSGASPQTYFAPHTSHPDLSQTNVGSNRITAYAFN
jgi:hypothetical protein